MLRLLVSDAADDCLRRFRPYKLSSQNRTNARLTATCRGFNFQKHKTSKLTESNAKFVRKQSVQRFHAANRIFRHGPNLRHRPDGSGATASCPIRRFAATPEHPDSNDGRHESALRDGHWRQPSYHAKHRRVSSPWNRDAEHCSPRSFQWSHLHLQPCDDTDGSTTLVGHPQSTCIRWPRKSQDD